MICGRHFKQLSDGAVFINTARGTLVNEDEMVEELRKGRLSHALMLQTLKNPRERTIL